MKNNVTIENYDNDILSTLPVELKEARNQEIETDIDTLRDMTNIGDPENIKLKEEVIKGILREGKTMVLMGHREAFMEKMIIETALSISSGRDWLGIPVKKSKTLFVDLVGTEQVCLEDMDRVKKAMDIEDADLPYVWYPCSTVHNLKDFKEGLCRIVEESRSGGNNQGISVIVIEHAGYSFGNGSADANDENKAREFRKTISEISAKTGCSLIFRWDLENDAIFKRDLFDKALGSPYIVEDHAAVVALTTNRKKIRLNKYENRKVVESYWTVKTELEDFNNIDPINIAFNGNIHYLDID